MRRYTALCLLFFLSACTRRTTTNNPDSGNAPAAPETLCFRHIEGIAGKDTTLVRLTISGDSVTGDLLYLPFEKDSRKGTINGTKEKNLIRGIWTYMQEGMQDTLSVEFRLNGDTLMQKAYDVNPQTGRQFLSASSAFSIGYEKADCNDLVLR